MSPGPAVITETSEAPVMDSSPLSPPMYSTPGSMTTAGPGSFSSVVAVTSVAGAQLVSPRRPSASPMSPIRTSRTARSRCTRILAFWLCRTESGQGPEPDTGGGGQRRAGGHLAGRCPARLTETAERQSDEPDQDQQDSEETLHADSLLQAVPDRVRPGT